jgi:hypothetical protein
VYAVPYLNKEVFEMTAKFPGVERVSRFVHFESKSNKAVEDGQKIEARSRVTVIECTLNFTK